MKTSTSYTGGLLSLIAMLALTACGEYSSPTASTESSGEATATAVSLEAIPADGPDSALAASLAANPEIVNPLAASKDEAFGGNPPPAPKQTATTRPAGPQPSTLDISPARLQLDDVGTGQFATGIVTLLNIGSVPITIQECKSSCGCTSTNCPKGKELQPGEEREVEIRVTAGTRARTISKTVTFKIVDQAPVILPVSVKVVAYVTITPATIDVEKVPDGRVVLRSNDEEPFRIVSMNPPVIEEFDLDAKIEHELYIDWNMWRELGQRRRLIFSIDHPRTNQVSAQVRPQFRSADSTAIDARDLISPTKPRDLRNPRPTPTDPFSQLKQLGVDPKLAIAVKYGRVDEISNRLESGLSEDDRNELLTMAAKYGQVQIMSLLVAGGATVDAADKRGRTALMSAVQSRNAEAVKMLVDQGANVNARDSLESTALQRASGSFGDVNVVETLIVAGAEVNVADKNGQTPLMWAARWGDVDRVQALLKAGADATVRDKQGITALDFARNRGDAAKETVAILQPLTDGSADASDS